MSVETKESTGVTKKELEWTRRVEGPSGPSGFSSELGHDSTSYDEVGRELRRPDLSISP